MRVLLVNGYPASNRRGNERFDEFRQHVRRVLKSIEKQEVTEVEIIERPRQELDEFLFEMHSEFAEPSHITNFDRLDFVFIAGDPSACPWSPAMRKLSLLAKMCMMTGKCLYGSGLGAGLLAFLCSTAGEYLRVLNNDGKGEAVADVQAVAPPSSHLLQAVGHSESMGTAVLLDTRTGDFYTFNSKDHAWVPRGNTGLMLHSSDKAKDYGSRVNTARAGTKTHRPELSHALYVSKRGDTRCCCRLESTSHPLFASSAFAASREFLVNCNSAWDLDEEISATGNNKYRVLVDSSRGPMLIEFGNCVGTHFVLRREYPETVKLLENFVSSKFKAFQVHEHVDRSYVSAISGSARLKDRLQLAQTKTTAAAALNSARSESHQPNNSEPHELPAHTATMTSGKTSPKRCRPVSAGPFRSTAKPADAVRTIRTSRSVYPSSSRATGDGGLLASPELVHTTAHAFTARSEDNNQSENQKRISRPQTARASIRVPTTEPKELQPEVESPAVDEAPSSTSPTPREKPPVKAHRRIRVAQRDELARPYCALDKFNALREAERAQHKDLYYSVVNDAPYISGLEQQQLEYQKSKLKWVAGPFRTAVGKASTQIKPEPSIFTRAPFIQKNTPFHIIQRRELEPSPPKQASPRAKAKPAQQRAASARPSRRQHR